MKAYLLAFLFFSFCTSLRNAETAPDAWQAAALQLVNQSRNSGCHCGDRYLPPARPLKFSPRLSAIALQHARYLHKKGRISHRGQGGTRVGQRADKAGYRWQYIGENIAMGYPTPAANVAAWLHSPGHCHNLMDPAYSEMGIARAGNVYVQVLAKPMD